MITTNASWYKSSPLLIWLQHPLDLCYHRRLYSMCLWHLTCCYAYVVLSCMSMNPRGKVFLFGLQSNSGSSIDGQISCWLFILPGIPLSILPIPYLDESCGCSHKCEASLAKDCQGCLRFILRGTYATLCAPWTPWRNSPDDGRHGTVNSRMGYHETDGYSA